ncbi:MAG: DEAD/DEAH box helicase family protein, partial [Gammaproteobacteria bacterium]|nr:DEAD/DEAH box helicase family protein [Gammaproteobacteria bacterium]
MQTQAFKNHIQALYRDISGSLTGFRNRYTQRLFIAEIVKTLTNSQHVEKLLVVEGPTGTGKTLAYLIACIPSAKELNKKLVLSTATVALQTQLLEKDIPLVTHSNLVDVKISLAKGRRRYLCPSLLEQHLMGDSGQADAFATQDYLQKTFSELRLAFITGEWQGDKDSWHQSISDDIWQKISNDRHGCLAAKCGHFKECPYFKARQELEEADVIIANHDLLLSDLSLGGGVLLPPPAETIYVIDEAHHLPDKTINHAGNWASLNGTLA